MTAYSESLGYRPVFVNPTKKGQACDACGQIFWVHPQGFAVGGNILRSHRRDCPVAPAAVRTPGVCDA